MRQAWRTLPVIALVALYVTMPSYAYAAANSDNESWIGTMFGVPASERVKITDAEVQSLGCIIGGSTAAIATIIFGGAAVVATGGQSIAVASNVAVPVIAAATFAGCMSGNAAALGLAWIQRNTKKVASNVIKSLPEVPPVSELLPTIQKTTQSHP